MGEIKISEIKQTINYPFQVASLIQQKNGEKKTLGIDSRLFSPNEKSETEKAMPLEMHSCFSRFVFTLIKKDTKTKDFVKANVPAEDAYYIFEKTKLAMQEILASKRIKAEDALSAAYTERFGMGVFKGKTPAEVLLESSNNKEALIKQGEFLNQNAEKFPANKKMIAAIKDAFALLKEGKLENKSTAPSNIVVIYNEPMKPLRSQKNEKGNCFVYGIKIQCDTSRNLPFMIEIMNCYAPLDVTSEGTLNPRMKEAEGTKKIFMNMTEKDWFETINRVHKTLENFESAKSIRQFSLSAAIDAENRRKAKEN